MTEAERSPVTPRTRIGIDYTACQAPECDRPARARGYCPRHYVQVHRYGRLTPEREHGQFNRCQAEGCERKPVAHGYCGRHYQQIRRHGRLTPERENLTDQRVCRVAGCTEKYAARGFCKKHYMQQYYQGRARRKARQAVRAA